MPRLSPSFILALLPVSLFAQLIGTYTVGPSPSDLRNMAQVTDMLHNQGVNGTVTHLDVDLTGFDGSEIALTIRDIYGRICYTGRLPGSQIARLDVHSLPSGIYLLDVDKGAQRPLARFIKAN